MKYFVMVDGINSYFESKDISAAKEYADQRKKALPKSKILVITWIDSNCKFTGKPEKTANIIYTA